MQRKTRNGSHLGWLHKLGKTRKAETLKNRRRGSQIFRGNK